jgi:hypothetical protein
MVIKFAQFGEDAVLPQMTPVPELRKNTLKPPVFVVGF